MWFIYSAATWINSFDMELLTNSLLLTNWSNFKTASRAKTAKRILAVVASRPRDTEVSCSSVIPTTRRKTPKAFFNFAPGYKQVTSFSLCHSHFGGRV